MTQSTLRTNIDLENRMMAIGQLPHHQIWSILYEVYIIQSIVHEPYYMNEL